MANPVGSKGNRPHLYELQIGICVGYNKNTSKQLLQSLNLLPSGAWICAHQRHVDIFLPLVWRQDCLGFLGPIRNFRSTWMPRRQDLRQDGRRPPRRPPAFLKEPKPLVQRFGPEVSSLRRTAAARAANAGS